MRKKNKKQIEQEKKEKGFSIYVNGANTNRGKIRKGSSREHDELRSPSPPPPQKSHRLKTAGGIYHVTYVLCYVASIVMRKCYSRNWLSGFFPHLQSMYCFVLKYIS